MIHHSYHGKAELTGRILGRIPSGQLPSVFLAHCRSLVSLLRCLTAETHTQWACACAIVSKGETLRREQLFSLLSCHVCATMLTGSGHSRGQAARLWPWARLGWLGHPI
ncbi:hypothetical protein N658DRAFT_355575 [Parathielavia hyrcaniae]|uniref:Uncharacterized protein n=1 Tax=Parathielavia hyrcaniae TaxID=113614 RepID=A0AAN6Q5K1_9PEZI|nr:hypothetical protein N658DRAFT_355575 [Parathielavia hyrcaniae]